jgi:DNA-directed RNA polymerase specialized sigma24 family protein
VSESSKTSPDFVDRVVELYGDTLYDLCQSVLWSTSNAQVIFRTILKEIRRARKRAQFETHERAWVLSIACARLQTFAQRHGRRLTPSEQIMLDANSDLKARFQRFDAYFHRLGVEDQILLLLRDKYGMPYTEISTALGTPEGSLKVRRQQALRTLGEWLYP